MSETLSKIHDEAEQLSIKIEKLIVFICSDKFEDLTMNHRVLLREQLSAMKSYMSILMKRIRLEDE